MAVPAPGIALGGLVTAALLAGSAAARSSGEPAAVPTAMPTNARAGLPTPAVAPAAGNRAGENAVRGADDAFGTTIGREEIGLYGAEDIRGFSPVAAGNVRIDGLYFDPVAFPSDRISGATTIRVGPSALGSPFPAPTGIVDIGLRLPEDETAASALISADSFGGVQGELDMALALTDRFSIGAGVTWGNGRFVNNTVSQTREAALIANWRPAPGVQLVPFISLTRVPRDDVGPAFLPAGDVLPPDPPRRRLIGPDWVQSRNTGVNAGAILDWTLRPDWQLKAGLFRSSLSFGQDFSNLLIGVQPDGRARQRVLADPRLFFVSTSGEVRLTRSISDGPRRHRLHVAVRGRSAFRRFGGSDTIDLGDTTIATIGTAPRPVFNFGPQEEDRVQQWTGALGYEGDWQGVGALSLGLQKSDYAKRIGLPGLKTATDAAPWLVNANAAVRLAGRTELYGGFVTGIEESGVAPENASNRNEALPAIITRQFDAGLRQKLGPVTLVAGLFQLSKPYFNIDPASRFGALGRVVSRGLETSVSGPVTPSLSLVAGAVVSDPQVTGDAVARGLTGPRPVGAIRRRLNISADWRPAFAPGLSFDIGVFANSATVATVNNAVWLPAQTFIDLGARYGFRLGGRAAVLRAQIFNAGGVNGVQVDGPGSYRINDGRWAQIYLTIDL